MVAKSAKKSTKPPRTPNPAGNPALLRASFPEYAKRAKVTLQTVHNWHGQEIVKCFSRGVIDVEESDRRVAEYRNRGTKGDNAGARDESVPYGLAEAQRQKENFAAMSKRLEFEKEAGLLIPVSEVAAVVAGEYASVRSRILGLGALIAPRVAMIRDADAAKALIDAEVTKILDGLAFDASQTDASSEMATA